MRVGAAGANQAPLKDKPSLPQSQLPHALAWSRLTHSIRQPDGGPTVSRCSDVPAGGPSDLEWSRESGRLDDGSIDYDLYRTLARRLRQDFVAQTTLSLARLAIRASMVLEAWKRPLPDYRS